MTYQHGKQIGPGDEPRAFPFHVFLRLLPYATVITLFFVGTTYYTGNHNDRAEVSAGLVLFSICLIVFTLLLRSDFGKPTSK